MSPHSPSGPLSSNDATSRPPTAVISPGHMAPLVPGPLTDQALRAWVVRHARCADSGLDPDEWFPAGIDPVTARQEAAAAIAVCASCQVRIDCLALSLRHWDVGQHGVWGGLVAADRARLRRWWPADHRSGRRRAAVAGMIAQPSSPQVPLRLAMGGNVQ